MFTLKNQRNIKKTKLEFREHKVQFNFEFILFIFNRFFNTWKNEPENKSYIIYIIIHKVKY